jgi:phospholipid-translocating ATPase
MVKQVHQVYNQAFPSNNIAHSDWKLKHAPSLTQNLSHDQQLTSRGRSDKHFSVQAEPPSLEIYKFSGLLNYGRGSKDAERDRDTSCIDSSTGAGGSEEQESLSIENVLWCNTVLCSSAAVGCVLYTGENIHTHMHTFMYSLRVPPRQ